VTNTGAALAVPDWPTTFGHTMLLFPWSGMVGGVFYEHTHRLVGALVGLLTLALGAALWLTESRASVRALGLLAIGLVGVQGVLGGLRVLLARDALAIVHGSVAQAFFGLLVALLVVTAPGWTAAAPRPAADVRGLSWLALWVTAATYLQIVLGALTTHAGWVLPHVAGAVVAAAGGAVLAARALGHPSARREVAGLARALALLLGVQLTLGVGAYVARFTGLAVPGGATGVLALPVTHRLTAALLLGTTVALTLRLWRLRLAGDAVPARRRAVVGAGAVSGRVPA
ncbi:MAG: COX15/CtaA family protein, partial [Candidatus Rokubacteria bacterium]|nr:COX15/CtaA family protein [Candidatus Rokubacteria bacterium]